MRADIVPGAVFPDHALPDHTETVRSLSEIREPRRSRSATAVAGRRAALREARTDWDLRKPGLREAWDSGETSPFHGWNNKQVIRV